MAIKKSSVPRPPALSILEIKIQNKNMQNIKGFSLIELIVAVGIFAILGAGVTYIIINSYSNFQGTGDRQAVAKFAQEGIEAVRAIRDNSWEDIEDAVGSNYGVSQDQNGVWQFAGSDNSQNFLTRVVTLANVYRDDNGDIVEAGGTVDINTKKVTVTVSGQGISDYTLTTYLTNWSNKYWTQKDWDGSDGSQFWQADNKMYLSQNISTSTSNQMALASLAGGWDDWSDLTADVSTTTVGVPKSIAFSSDSQTMYVVGDATHDFRAYDVSDIRNGNITLLWALNISEFSSGGTTVVLHPNGNYAYISNASHSATGSPKSIAIIDLNNHTYTTLAGQAAVFRDAWLSINPEGDYLYAFDGYGKVYVHAISNGGATLTTVNTGQQITYNTSWRLNPAFRDTNYTDQYWFFSTAGDYNTGVYYDFRKMYHNTTTHQFTVQYGLQESSSGMFRGLEYLDAGGDSGYVSRYVVISSLTDQEFKIYKDGASGPTLVDSINPSVGATFMGAALDGDGMAFIYSSGYLVQMDISDPANISEVANTATVSGVNTYPMKQIWYNDTLGGLFYIQSNTLAGTKTINFVKRPGTAGVSYLTNGYATSSIFDIGSSDQTLSALSIEQNIPSGCDLDIILQTSDSSDFSSYVSETFSDSSSSAYTSTTPVALNSHRFLRYITHMEPCTTSSANDTTPTIYSFKLKYK